MRFADRDVPQRETEERRESEEDVRTAVHSQD
jgi:hypothetical protein